MIENNVLNGFCELTLNETELINAGGVWGAVATGLIVGGLLVITCVGAPAAAAALVTGKVVATAAGAKAVMGTVIALEAAGAIVATAAAYKS